MKTWKELEFYGLSTCGWCRKTKAWLDERSMSYKLIHVDLLDPERKQEVKERLGLFVPRLSFPILIVDNGSALIQGYDPKKFQEVLD